MAIEVAQAYVTITPSMRGIQKKISSELTPALKSAGKDAGKELESGLESGAKSGASKASRQIVDSLKKAGKDAGDGAGKHVDDGLKENVGKATDEVAKSVETKLKGAFGKVGESLKSVGTMTKGSFGQLGTEFKQMVSNIGSSIGGTKVGQIFSSITDGARSAASKAAGVFKGIGSTIGGALTTATSTAKSVFSGIKAMASNAVDGIKQRFGGMASGVGGVLSKLGGAAGKASASIVGALGTVATAAGGVAAAVGAAAAAIGGMALNAYGDFEQLQGGISLALGDEVWGTVEARSKQAFANVQMSQNDYLSAVNYMATGLREALGGDQQAAADLADRVITTQADVVSAMGITQDAAQNAFQGIMKGNFTMLDNLGLGIKPTKEGFQEIIDKMNEWNATQSDRTATQYNIDNLADCQSALADYVEYLGLSGYAANEGAQTIQGSISKMKGAWTDWVAELAKPDADMESVTKNLSESIQDVAENAIPALSRAIGTAFSELPNIVTTVGPQLGQGLLTIIDEATGGLGTKVVEAFEPISSAVGDALSGAFSWFSENQGTLSDIGGKLAEIGGSITSALGGAISTVAPIIGNLASAALPVLSAGLDFLGGAFNAVCNAVSAFIQIITPVAEALSPVAETIGGAICDALSTLGEWLGSIDFGPFVETVTGAFQGIADFIGGVIETVAGFFQGIADFFKDPVAAVESGLEGLRSAFGATDATAGSSMSGVQSSVKSAMDVSTSAIRGYNGTKLNPKSTTAKVTGNAIDGGARSSLGSTQGSINSLSGKSVSVSVTGNAVDGRAESSLWATIKAQNSLANKDVTHTVRTVTVNEKVAMTSAKGHVFKMPAHAGGAIVTKPIITSVGLVGEAGAEAYLNGPGYTGVFPLTNRRYTGPFASEIADQVVSGMRQVSAGGRTFNLYVQPGASDSASKVAQDIASELELIFDAKGW